MCEPGLHVIYDEHQGSSQTEVDVVAVHGLNFKNNPNHALATWKRPSKSPTGALWIRDFLPDVLKRPCRVLLFAYNSSPAMGAAALRLDEHARMLLQCLLEKRMTLAKGMEKRPIIFLCHSLGGIVVKSALVEAQLDPAYTSIVQSTRLLVFFAVPHLGGNYSAIGDVAAKVVRAGLRTPDNDLLDGLKPGSRDVIRRFEQARHIPQGRLVISFYETLDYRGLGIIVEEKSAVLNLPADHEQRRPLKADHSKVCKFETRDDAMPVMSLISLELERALEMHLKLESKPENVHWLVPRRGTPLFTGREEIAQRLKSAILPDLDLTSQRADPGQKVFVLTGIGGQGKSEICIQVANQVRAFFWGVFWVDASSRATATIGFAKIANALGSEAKEIDDVLLLLSNCSEKKNWLLVLDNADDEDTDYSKLMPSGDRGTVLLTSRNPECQFYSTVGHENVGNLGQEECVSLVLKASRVPHDSWAERQSAATVIARDLAFHTLALVQAGAYIALGHCSMEEYPALFRIRRDELLRFGPAQLGSRYKNVYATFEVSVQALESSGDALELLAVLSAMHYDDIPLQIFGDARSGVAHARRNLAEDDTNDTNDTLDRLSGWHVRELPPFLAEEDGDKGSRRLSDAVKQLNSLALVTRSVDVKGVKMLSLHPLVHSWMIIRQSREQRSAALRSYCSFISLWTYGELPWTPYRDRLGPHLSSLLENPSLIQDALRVPPMRQSLFQLCRLLDDIRHHKELESLLHAMFGYFGVAPESPADGFLQLYYLQALNQYNLGNVKGSISVLTQILGRKEMHTATPECEGLRRNVVEALARGYLTDGQTKKAVAMLEDLDQQASKPGRGPQDRDRRSRLATRYMTGIAYRADGQTDKALALMEDVASIESRTLEQGDPSRAATAYELARCFLRAGRIKDAVRHLEDAVQKQKDYLPETHPTMLSLQSGLGRALIADFQVPAAIEILERVSDLDAATNGLDHPSRLAGLVTLGSAYESNGQSREAIRAYEEVLRLSKFDEAHPNRLETQYELSVSYLSIGQTQKALSLLERTRGLQQRTLDSDHPSLVRVQILLGQVYSQTGQSGKGIGLLEEATGIQEARLGEDHPGRLEAEYQLGLAYLRDGQEKRAIGIFENIVRIEEASLDDQNPDRAVSKLALGRGYLADGRAKEAAEIFEEVVALLQSSWAPNHPDVLAARHELARSYFAVGRVEEARALFEEVVEAQAIHLPADHPDQLASQRLLSLTLLQLGRNEDALALLEKVSLAQDTADLSNADSVLATQGALAKAYLATGHLQKAAELYEDVLRVQAQTLAPRHSDVLDTRQQLGAAYLALDETKHAIAVLEQAVSGYAQTHEPGHTARLAAEHMLGAAYIQSGQLPRAITVLEAVAANAAPHLDDTHPSMRAIKYDLAQCYLKAGRSTTAVPLIQAVLAAEDATLEKHDPSRLKTLRLLAYAYLASDTPPPAIRCFQELASLYRQTHGAQDARFLSATHDLAIAYRDDSQPKKAAALLKSALATAPPALNSNPNPNLPLPLSLLAAMQFELAGAYLDLNKPEKAIPLLQQVEAIKTRDAAVAVPDWDTLRATLAGSYRANTMLYKLLFLCGMNELERYETVRSPV